MLFIINLYVLAGLLQAFHYAWPVGIIAGFGLLAMARKKEDRDSFLTKLYLILFLPTILTLLVGVAIGLVSYYGLDFLMTPSVTDMTGYALLALASLALVVWLLRSGVQFVDSIKSRFTSKTELERNCRTDIREIHKFLPAEKSRFDPLKHINPIKGVFLGVDANNQPIYIKKGDWETSHTLLSGRTRSGKGIALQILGTQSIQMGEFFVVLDPKCDDWMPHIFKQAADRAGQPYHFLDLRQNAGPQINLFAGCDAETLENMLIGAFSLTEKGTDADFYRLGDREAARQAARYIAKNQNATPRQVLAEFAEQWAESAPGFAAMMREMAELPAVNRTQAGGIDLETMAKTGGCLYVVGDMLNTRIVRMQRMILMRLMLLAKNRSSFKERKIIRVVADEFRVHISRPFIISLSASAGWRMLSILAFQSFEDLRDCPADLDADLVRGASIENCAIQLSYRIKDTATAEILASQTGEILVDDETRIVEKNIALAETVDGKRSLRQAGRYLVDTCHFSPLRSHAFSA